MAARNLIVVTTAVTNAVELVGNPATTVVMTGGVIRPQTFGASGELTAATLREIHVDQAFLATHSVSVKAGLTYPSFEEVDAKRAIIRGRDRGDPARGSLQVRTRASLVRIANIDAVHKIITTPGVDPAEADAIRDLGIELIIAEPAAAGQMDLVDQPVDEA